jgi:hypothetical protein
MQSAPTISFDWKPSRGWRAVRWGLLIVGAACLAWSGLGVAAKAGVALLAVWLEWRHLRFEQHWRGSDWCLDGDGAWQWQRADDTRGEAMLAQATQLGPLLVLNLRRAGERIDLPIWPDQLDAATRRRLRVRLGTLHDDAAQPQS